MTDKEKAKAYDEAVKKAREIAANPNRMLQLDDFEELFPGITDESKDKRIIRAINNMLPFIPDEAYANNGVTKEGVLNWLKKQKEKPMSATEVLVKAGLKPYKDGNQWCILAGDNIQEGICGFGDTIDEALYQFLMEILEKQKDASKAMEAVEKIDKYIDAHTANAHDMKDSEPDKKYYQGWDDALGKIAGILQDVYSDEKQKERKDYNKLYEDIAKAEWFKKAYEGKSLGCDYEQEEQKPAEWSDDDEYLLSETVQHLEELIRIDKARHCGVNVQYYQRDIDWLNSLPERFALQRRQEWSEEDNIGWDEAFACVTRAEKAAKNEEELQNAVTAEKWLKEIKFKYYVHPVKQEWSEEDERMRNALWNLLKIYYAQDCSMTCVGIEAGKFRDWLKSLPERLNLQPKSEWSEEDEECRKELIQYIEQRIGDGTTGQSLWKKWYSWLCSIPLNIKKKNEDVAKLCSNEWNEEDKDYYDTIVRKLEVIGDDSGLSNNQIKFLREHCPSHCLEWSEEDEKIMQTMIKDGDLKPSEVAWLKSRRPAKDCSSCAKHLEGYISGRSDAKNKLLEQFGALITPEDELHIKPRWKPSEEQMEALRLAIPIVKNCISGMVDHAEILESLDSDLTKI